jgi:serine/threonine-protein kinase
MRITLTVTAGPHEGRVFMFAGHDTFLVGRSKRAHFRLPGKDRYFSRVHFLVEVNPPQCGLLDMGSRNGTYVNGERVTRRALKDGDQVRAGRSILRVAIAEVPAEPAAATVPAGATLETTTPAAAAPVEISGTRPGPCRVCGGPVAAVPLSFPPGPFALCLGCQEQIAGRPQPLDGYRLVRELGRGGMGVVHLAVRHADGEPVALKTITPAVSGAGPAVERFLREADILRELDHPHIVAFRAMGEAAGQLYFAMDYVRGTDAGRLLKRQGPFAVGRAVALAGQALAALAYAHARGFVHRDVKPSNLLVTEEGGREVVKVADFGLARVYQASQLSGLTLAGDVGGTVAFMAPEQITAFREARPAADQYSAAATLYALLSGACCYDFPTDLNKQLLKVLHEEPVPLRDRRPAVPAGLADAVRRGLAREPADRWPDVAAFRAALRPFEA